MANTIVPRGNRARRFLARNRVVSRRALVWLLIPLLLVLAVPVILHIQTPGSAAPTTPSPHPEELRSVPLQPADRFIQSVVTDDGALGWQQLCPSLQAQLPQSELVQQANTQRDAVVKHGVRLTYKFVSIQPQQGGGAVHEYVVTARWPNGSRQTRTFDVMTQPSGCVEDVQNH